MNDVDYLLTVAEISVTFAGLAAIVTVLRGPRRRAWSPREMVGLWGLLGPSLAVFVLALMPGPLLSIGMEPGEVWRVLSGALAVGWLLAGGKAIRALRRATSRGYPDPTPFSNPLLILLGSAGFAVAAVNLSGFFGTPAASLFMLGLLASLAFSVVVFAAFLYTSTSTSSRARREAALGAALDEGEGI